MRKIVIPTDFSDNALQAAKYTLEIFKYFTCDIFIIHAFADEVYEAKAIEMRSVFEDVKQATKQNTEIALNTFTKQLTDHFSNPKHQFFKVAVFGSLVDVVNDLVDKENIDIVAMGTKGKTKAKDITFGSNALQVMKYVKCPVLAVPEVYDDYLPKKILFPSNYMLPYKKRELKLVSTLSERIAASILSLHVSKFKELSNRQQDNKAFLELQFQNNQLEFIRERDTEITKTINTCLNKYDIDMLVMINSRHSYLEDVLYTSTIEKIGLSVKIPFLVLQNLQRY